MRLKALFETFQKTKNEKIAKIWRECHPRVFKNTNSWFDARIPSVAMTHSCAEMLFHGNQASFADRTITAAACQICQYEVPTFFIESEFAHAALRSAPSDETVWSQMKLPFEAGIFMLPKNFLRHPLSSVPYVGFARLTGDKKYFIPSSSLWIKYDETRFIFFTSLPDAPGFSSTVLNLSSADTPFIQFDQSEINEEIKGRFDDLLENADNDLLHTLARLTFSILCALMARPELVEKEGRKLGFCKKTKSELWTPNRIGRRYQIKRTVAQDFGSQTGLSKRAHWRRGHFRNQPFGSESLERKIIWIEPMLIGAAN